MISFQNMGERVLSEHVGGGLVVDDCYEAGFTFTARREVGQQGGGTRTEVVRVTISRDEAKDIAAWIERRTTP